jgi:hypothetical protein
MSESNLDRVRGAVLDRIERSERNYKLAFLVGAGVEGAFFIAYLALADFSDRLHLLLLLSTIAVYTILACGLGALGAHVSRCTERVLKALEVAEKGPKP